MKIVEEIQYTDGLGDGAGSYSVYVVVPGNDEEVIVISVHGSVGGALLAIERHSKTRCTHEI